MTITRPGPDRSDRNGPPAEPPCTNTSGRRIARRATLATPSRSRRARANSVAPRGCRTCHGRCRRSTRVRAGPVPARRSTPSTASRSLARPVPVFRSSACAPPSTVQRAPPVSPALRQASAAAQNFGRVFIFTRRADDHEHIGPVLGRRGGSRTGQQSDRDDGTIENPNPKSKFQYSRQSPPAPPTPFRDEAREHDQETPSPCPTAGTTMPQPRAHPDSATRAQRRAVRSNLRLSRSCGARFRRAVRDSA